MKTHDQSPQGFIELQNDKTTIELLSITDSELEMLKTHFKEGQNPTEKEYIDVLFAHRKGQGNKETLEDAIARCLCNKERKKPTVEEEIEETERQLKWADDNREMLKKKGEDVEAIKTYWILRGDELRDPDDVNTRIRINGMRYEELLPEMKKKNIPAIDILCANIITHPKDKRKNPSYLFNGSGRVIFHVTENEEMLGFSLKEAN